MPTALTLDDRFALADLTALYAMAVDTREFDRLRDVFLADGRLDTGRGVREGIDAVLEAMQGLLRYEATSHVLGQQLLEPEADAVRGLTYCTAHHLTDRGQGTGRSDTGPGTGRSDTGPGTGRSDKVMHIRYHDRFVSVDEGWRIADRRLEIMWTDEQPVY